MAVNLLGKMINGLFKISMNFKPGLLHIMASVVDWKSFYVIAAEFPCNEALLEL